ncbi:8356_t:CDS:2, partial [Scutellospora calospora]
MAQNICCQKNFADDLCINCQKKRIEKKFLSWTCGDRTLDQYIKKNQLDNLDNPMLLPIKWIPYEEFEDFKLLRRGGEGVIYIATWKFGPLGFGPEKVILKCHHGSTNDMFLKENWILIEKIYEKWDVNNEDRCVLSYGPDVEGVNEEFKRHSSQENSK